MARIKYYNKQTGQWEYADNVLMPGGAYPQGWEVCE